MCQVSQSGRDRISLENIDARRKTERGLGERVETIDQKVELQRMPCVP